MGIDQTHCDHVHDGDDNGHHAELHTRKQPAQDLRGQGRVDTHEPKSAKTDTAGDDRTSNVGEVGARDFRGIHVAVALTDPAHRNQTLNDSADRFAKSRADHPPAHAGCEVDRPTDNDLQDRRNNTHQEDGLGILVGEEDALAHQNDAR